MYRSALWSKLSVWITISTRSLYTATNCSRRARDSCRSDRLAGIALSTRSDIGSVRICPPPRPWLQISLALQVRDPLPDQLAVAFPFDQGAVQDLHQPLRVMGIMTALLQR